MEKNTVVFIPDSEEAGRLFKGHLGFACKYHHQEYGGNFYFSMTIDDDLDIISKHLQDNIINKQYYITGKIVQLYCESPEEILMDFGNFSSDMEQYGVYFIPGQVSRHEEYNDDEEGIQNAQSTREENMTLRILHDIPNAIQLLRKTLTENISENHKKEIENLLKGMGLQVE